MRRIFVEDENGNRGYLPECHGLCGQKGGSACPTPTTCRSKPTAAQHLIVGALALMLVAWLAWQFIAGIFEGVKS
jgi:hypothetical protein